MNLLQTYSQLFENMSWEKNAVVIINRVDYDQDNEKEDWYKMLKDKEEALKEAIAEKFGGRKPRLCRAISMRRPQDPSKPMNNIVNERLT